MKNWFLKPLLKGALVTIPVIVTTWVIWGLVKWIDGLGKKALEPILLDHLLFPGSGLLIMVVLLLLVGLLFQFSFIHWIFRRVENSMLRFPLVKTVYSAVKDLAGMFDNSQQKGQQVVLVDMQQSGLGYLVGMVTNDQLPKAFEPVNKISAGAEKALVAVYLPMSYMVGGYTLFIKRELVKPIDMSFEEAMRFAMTAGVSKKPEQASG
jgi:uncharacterized membrane protein